MIFNKPWIFLFNSLLIHQNQKVSCFIKCFPKKSRFSSIFHLGIWQNRYIRGLRPKSAYSYFLLSFFKSLRKIQVKFQKLLKKRQKFHFYLANLENDCRKPAIFHFVEKFLKPSPLCWELLPRIPTHRRPL